MSGLRKRQECVREVISINYGVHYTKYNGISLLSAMHPPEFKAMVNEDINAFVKVCT